MNKIDEFFSNTVVLDTETTGVDEKSDIIELSMSFPENANTLFDNITNYTSRYKPTQSVPAESSAIHFITDEDLVNCTEYKDEIELINTFLGTRQYFVGHNVQFDRKMLMDNHIRYIKVLPSELIDDSRWICTLRFAKKLFAEDPEFSNLKLSYLWFKFELYKTCTHKIVPHSAEDDVYMCYMVLNHLVNIAVQRGYINPNLDIGKQIVDYCNIPITYTVMPFGKHKGMSMSEVPLNYIEWMIANSDILNEDMPNFEVDLAYTFLKEYESRK